MPSFTTGRERRLWILTGAVVLAIFATLGVAGELAAELRRRELLDALFFIAFLGLLASIVLVARRVRVRGVEAGILLAVGAAYTIAIVRTGIPEERSHLIEYTVVALLVHEALLERRRGGASVRSPALVAFATTAAIGIVDELIQAVLPNRVFDLVDIAFNVLAAALAVIAGTILRPRLASAT